jgi:hypothetical protein
MGADRRVPCHHALLLAVVAAGCGGTVAAGGAAGGAAPAATVVPAQQLRGEEAEVLISGVVTAALQADSRRADSAGLFAPHAIVIADGATRFGAPRFTGVGPGGETAITASQIEQRSGLAWGVIEYRWLSAEENLAREGRATVVLAPRGDGGWWIVHAHSSTVR